MHGLVKARRRPQSFPHAGAATENLLVDQKVWILPRRLLDNGIRTAAAADEGDPT
jgi:hypothetical protein